MSEQILAGTIHDTVPTDLQTALMADTNTLELWQRLTPLGRNEFICWVDNAVKDETRARRIQRTAEELHEGRKRPCCWLGCIHRTDKEISPSVKGILEKKQDSST